MIRWPILRPGFPRESAVFDGDDASATLHFGAFLNDRLIGVASIYLVPCPNLPDMPRAWQLRGMATVPEVRGVGAGKALVGACQDAVREAGDHLLWCNARTSAADFYAKQGWRIISDVFEIPTVGPHYRMMKNIAHPA